MDWMKDGIGDEGWVFKPSGAFEDPNVTAKYRIRSWREGKLYVLLLSDFYIMERIRSCEKRRPDEGSSSGDGVG